MTKKTHAIHLTAQPLKQQKGINLVELMIAILLGLFLVIGVGNILLSDQMSFNAANRLARVQENGHLAKNMLISDLKRARYMGANININANPNSIAGTLGPVNPAVNCNNNTNWGRMVGQGLLGIDDSQNVAGVYACVAANYLRGDVLTLRFSSPWTPPAQDFVNNPDRLYIRHAFNESRIFTGQNQGAAGNSDILAATEASTHELIAYSYYIGNSGRQCSGQAVPSLFRVRLNNQGIPVSEELFPGIEDFHVQFSINGINYNDANINTNWNGIVATQFWLLARSECAEMGLTDNTSYNPPDPNALSTNGNPYPFIPNDQFRRQVYTGIVSHRN